MADNVAITAGVGTTLASDDIGGVQYPRAKLSLGADGTAVDAVAGAGAVSTGVQRLTLASDDPAVVALQIIDDWDEANRAAANIIAGQVAIAAGTGAITANTVRVVTASDDLLLTAYTVTAATLANVASSATNVTLFASNAAAKGRTLFNDSASASLYLKYGATASATSFSYKIGPGETWEAPDNPLYTGIIDGIWTAAVGSARTTEV